MLANFLLWYKVNERYEAVSKLDNRFVHGGTMQSPALEQKAARHANGHHVKPWKKLLAFLALIAIPAICTALYSL